MILEDMVKTIDLAIGGKVLVATLNMDVDQFMHVPKDVIKDQLVRLIVAEVVKNKMVEFTTQDDYATLRKIIHARMYVAPDEQVKLLRIHKVI